MKKFKFSLESVLSYKQQVLDALQAEHSMILAQVRAQEEEIEACRQAYRACNEEYRQQMLQGLPMTDIWMFQSRLDAIEREIQRKKVKLAELRKKEENKRSEVVEAKKESTSIEKLREKKLAAYRKEEAKSEEQFVEDFVSMTRVINAAER